MRADPTTWRLVLVPHEGAPAVLHEAISRGREAVVTQLAAALGGERGLRAPDPELAAHLLSALADEAARLLLADPDRYPPERVLVLARWFLARMVPPAGVSCLFFVACVNFPRAAPLVPAPLARSGWLPPLFEPALRA